MIDQGNLIDRHHQNIPKRIMVNLGLLKSGKVELRRTIDQGNLKKTSWDMMQQVAPHREEPLLDGNAQSVRYGEIIHDGSGQPDSVNYQEEAESETFVMGSDAAEFVNKVKDQVRKRQKRMSNVADSGEEHSIIWGMFMAATMNAATFMGKNFVDIQNSIMNSRDLTLKHMFDITSKLVSEQDEINNLDKIHWGRNSWKQLSLIGDETVINLQRTKVYVFSDSVLCLGKVHQHPESNEAWKNRVAGIRSERSYRDYDGINGEPTEFEWNIFPGFTTLQLCGKVTDLLSNLGETPETFTGRILFMSMFNDISCDRKGNKEECVANAKVVTILAKKFGIGQWSFIGPGSEKKWYSMEENSPTRNLGSDCGRNVVGIRRKRTSYFPRNNSIVPVKSQKQRTWKTVDSLLCRSENN